jgi:hypothetical protein
LRGHRQKIDWGLGGDCLSIGAMVGSWYGPIAYQLSANLYRFRYESSVLCPFFLLASFLAFCRARNSRER